MFTLAPGCIVIEGRRLRWALAGFCAIGVDNATSSHYHSMCLEVRYAVFFWGGRRFLLFCQKVSVCCPLRLSKRPHRNLASKSRCTKYAIQNFTMFSINRSYVLQLWQASTIPYSTKPAKRVLHAHSRINKDPFLRDELSRETPNELAFDKFLKTSSGNLRSLLNCRSERDSPADDASDATFDTTDNQGRMFRLVGVYSPCLGVQTAKL